MRAPSYAFCQLDKEIYDIKNKIYYVHPDSNVYFPVSSLHDMQY